MTNTNTNTNTSNNSTNPYYKIDPQIKYRLDYSNCISVLYQLQPTIKAQRQLYARWLHIYSRNIHITFYVKSPQYLTRLEKLLKTKKLSPIQKLDLAGILETSGWLINEFCKAAAKEGYPEHQIERFVKNLMVTPEENMRLCDNLRSIITLQQDKILSERFQLLI